MPFSSRIGDYADALPRRVDAAIEESAKAIAGRATGLLRSRGTVDSGNLVRSIRVERRGIGEWAVEAGSDEAYYARMVEYGHFVKPPGGRRNPPVSYVPARPFLLPATIVERALTELRVRKAMRAR